MSDIKWSELWKGEFSAGTQYEVSDSVSYNGSSYTCILRPTIGTIPTNVTYWQLLARKGIDGTNIGDVVGPSSAIDGNFASFDTTTGKLIKDSAKGSASFDPAGSASTVQGNLDTHESDTTTHGRSGNLVGDSDTQTLTNKRITKRIVTATDATSITPNSDNADITYQANTQTAGTLTINADTGTPTNGQFWELWVKATNAQTASFNAVYIAMGTALPTTFPAGKNVKVLFQYDSNSSKWGVLAVNVEQ